MYLEAFWSEGLGRDTLGIGRLRCGHRGASGEAGLLIIDFIPLRWNWKLEDYQAMHEGVFEEGTPVIIMVVGGLLVGRREMSPARAYLD